MSTLQQYFLLSHLHNLVALILFNQFPLWWNLTLCRSEWFLKGTTDRLNLNEWLGQASSTKIRTKTLLNLLKCFAICVWTKTSWWLIPGCWTTLCTFFPVRAQTCKSGRMSWVLRHKNIKKALVISGFQSYNSLIMYRVGSLLTNRVWFPIST